MEAAITGGRNKSFCPCGTLVWDYPQGRRPKYTETIICPKCGQDNSIRAPFWWVLRFAAKRLRKVWKVYMNWAYLSKYR